METWRESCREEDPCPASKILSSFVAKEVRNTGEGRKGGKMGGRLKREGIWGYMYTYS